MAAATVNETVGSSGNGEEQTKFLITKEYMDELRKRLAPWLDKVEAGNGKISLLDEYINFFGKGKKQQNGPDSGTN